MRQPLLMLLLLCACDPPEAWPCGFGSCDDIDPTGGSDEPPIHPCALIAEEQGAALLETHGSPWNYVGPWSELLDPSATMRAHSSSSTHSWWSWDGAPPASGAGARLQGEAVRLPITDDPFDQPGALRVAYVLDFEYAPDSHVFPHLLVHVPGQRDPVYVVPRNLQVGGLTLYYTYWYHAEPLGEPLWVSESFVGWAHASSHAEARDGKGPYIDTYADLVGFVPAGGWCTIADTEGVDESG